MGDFLNETSSYTGFLIAMFEYRKVASHEFPHFC